MNRKLTKEKRKILKTFMDNIDLSKGVDVSTVFPQLQANTYFAFKTGGPHYFWQCEKEKPGFPYDSFVWPYVFSMTKKNKGGNSILFGSIAKTKLSYPLIKLYSGKETRVQRNFRRGKLEKRTVPKCIEMSLHRVLAKIFVPGFEEGLVVDHVNGNRVNYMLQNLRWITHEENSRGTPEGKNCPDEIYRLIQKTNWFNGRGSNNILTQKEMYYEKKKQHSLRTLEG